MSVTTQIVHISDTHFGQHDPEVTEALVSRINHIEPDLLIWSGDITQRARRGQFKTARRFLKRLSFRNLISIPGNHDVPLYNLPLRLVAPYFGYRRYFPGLLQAGYCDDAVAVIGINSCHLKHYKNGRFHTDTIDRVRAFLTAQPTDRIKMVVAHHPVDAIADKDQHNIVPQAEQALSQWCEAGMDLILGGHIHHQFVRSLSRRYPRLPASVWVSQAGTANSARVRSQMGNSFNQLQVDADTGQLRIRIWEYLQEQNRFGAAGWLYP